MDFVITKYKFLAKTSYHKNKEKLMANLLTTEHP